MDRYDRVLWRYAHTIPAEKPLYLSEKRLVENWQKGLMNTNPNPNVYSFKDFP